MSWFDYFWSAVGDVVGTTASFSVDIFLEIMNFTFTVLPSSSGLPDEVDQAFLLAGEQVALLNYFVPVDTIVTIISLFVALQLVVIMYKLSLRLISMFRGVDMHSSVKADFAPTGEDSAPQYGGGAGTADYIRSKFKK
jgi:hypothetical protein